MYQTLYPLIPPHKILAPRPTYTLGTLHSPSVKNGASILPTYLLLCCFCCCNIPICQPTTHGAQSRTLAHSNEQHLSSKTQSSLELGLFFSSPCALLVSAVKYPPTGEKKNPSSISVDRLESYIQRGAKILLLIT